MSMDKVFKCAEKAYVSPPIALKEFLKISGGYQQKIGEFFNAVIDNNHNGHDTHDLLGDASSSVAEIAHLHDPRNNFIAFMTGLGYSSEIAAKIIETTEYKHVILTCFKDPKTFSDSLRSLFDEFPISEYEVRF